MSSATTSAAADHPRIWLQNAEDAKAAGEGRLWCEDKVWPVDDNDREPTEYVRADIVQGLVTEVSELREIAKRLSTIGAGFAEFHLKEQGFVPAGIKRLFPEIDAALSSSRKQGE
ncbi:hypothetical protein V5F77_05400 [Xanthobacter sp. DSM 24535]|uniref:hypothetical protein n=1 Tax=Roseixanthobacter psychrophilus TaxID=3119917 RepID=UPI003727D184